MTAAQIFRAVHAALVSSVLVLSLFLNNREIVSAELWVKSILIAALLIQAVFLTTRDSLADDYSPAVRIALALAALFTSYVLIRGMFGASYASREFVSRYSMYFSFGVALIPVAVRPKVLRRVILAASVCGFLEGLFGIAQRFTGSWNPAAAYVRNAAVNSFGLFRYENSYGAYAALLIPMTTGLLAYRMADSSGVGTAFSLRRIVSRLNIELGSGVYFLLIAVLIMMVALVVSGARESTLVMAGFYATAIFLFIPGRMKIVLVLLIALAAGCIAFAADSRFVERLLAGFESEQLMKDAATRMNIAKMNLQLFFERPWAGWGMGMYKYVSSRYQTFGGDEFNTWNYHIHGHSTLMDLLIEGGLIGAVSALGIVMTPLVFLFGKVGRDGSRFRKIMKSQGLMALATLVLMLVSDSHLRTPAIVFLFILQLGILAGCSSPYVDPGADATLRPLGHWRSEPIRVGAAAVLIALLAAGMSRDVIAQARIHQIQSEPMPKERRVELLTRLEPDNPAHWDLAAEVHLDEAFLAKDRTAQTELLERSKTSAEQALRLAPHHGPYAHLIGEILLLQDDRENALAMYQKALELSPSNIKFKTDLMLVYVYLAGDTESILKRDRWTARARALYNELEQMKGSDGKGIDSIRIRSERRRKQFMDFVQSMRDEGSGSSDAGS